MHGRVAFLLASWLSEPVSSNIVPLVSALPGAVQKQCAKSVVTDGLICGENVIEESVKDALSCGYKDCKIGPIKTRCPKICLKKIKKPKTCEVSTVCEYRVRVELTGGVSIVSFQNASVDFEYKRHYLVEGDPVARKIVEATDNEVIHDVIRRLLAEQKSEVQGYLDKWKRQLLDMLIDKLSKDDTFGDYSFVRGFLGKSSVLVETLLPAATVSAVAQNESTVAIVEIPGAEEFAETTVCRQVSRQRHFWVRALPFLLITALIAWKCPKVGLAIAVVGVFLSTGLVTNTVCTQGVPFVAAGRTVAVRAPMPGEIRDFGGPDELTFALDFHDGALRAAFDPLATAKLEEVLQHMVAKVGNAKGKMPVTISGANINLQPNGDYITLAPGSWVDFDGKLDARCAPKCGVSI